jgi:hypothetical protein
VAAKAVPAPTGDRTAIVAIVKTPISFFMVFSVVADENAPL